MTGSSCRRTKSQTGAERSAWRDTSESDRGKETPRYLMNIQKSDSPTDLKVFTEWDIQQRIEFSVKISYGWVAALEENIARIASDCQVAMIVVIWGSEDLYCMSSFTHAASLYVFSAGTAAALSVATVTSMRCGCTLTKHATRDCQVALIVLIWGVAWWSVRKWKWNQICLLWYYCELFGLFNSIECFVISQNGGCWLIASWHGNNSKQSQACKRTEFLITRIPPDQCS